MTIYLFVNHLRVGKCCMPLRSIFHRISFCKKPAQALELTTVVLLDMEKSFNFSLGLQFFIARNCSLILW